MKKFMELLSLILLLTLSSHVLNSSALYESAAFMVKTKNTQCICKQIPSSGYRVSGSFSVTFAYNHAFIFRCSYRPAIDFTVTVQDPTSSGFTYSLKGRRQDKFAFVTTTGGRYKFCFRNPYAPAAVEEVYYSIEITPMKEMIPPPENINPVEPLNCDTDTVPMRETASEYDKLSARLRHPHTPLHHWIKICRRIARTTDRQEEKPQLGLGLQGDQGRTSKDLGRQTISSFNNHYNPQSRLFHINRDDEPNVSFL